MLGKNLRKLRLNKNISLEGLAEQTGVTAGFLSQVERNLADPSITTVRRIAKALEVPIFYLFMEEEEFNPIIRKNDRRWIKMPQSQIAYELLTPGFENQMEIIISHLEPGVESSEIPLSHSGEEFDLVLTGKVELIIGSKSYDLDEGDSSYYQATMPHKLKNIGEEEAKILSAITPPNF